MAKRSKWRGIVQRGDIYGHLTVIGSEEAKHSGIYVECECSCGHPKCRKTKLIRVDHLVKGESLSCGRCSRSGKSEISAKRSHYGSYRSYQKMMDRCYNPKHPAYAQYGGRGIVVCDEWKASFKAFAEHMGERPNGLTLDRINTNGNYEPGNCRWATMAEQNRNRSNASSVTINGQTHSVTEWAEILGIQRQVIFGRLRAGWDAERSLTTPVRLRRWGKRPVNCVEQ